MESWVVLASSAVVAAIVGALSGHLSQRSLMTRQAQLDYKYEARKALYAAVGPLRFQLMIAARDVVRRVTMHGNGQWNMDVKLYYGHSFIYRTLRPLAISILIEREMTYADFGVDPEMLILLRFETAAQRSLTASDPVPYHPNLDWSNETQHVFRDNLRIAAASLITGDASNANRVMDYSEFLQTFPDPHEEGSLRPLVSLMNVPGGSLTENPVFWARMVGYAYVCSRLLDEGAELGFGARPVDAPYLLAKVNDKSILSNLNKYPAIFDKIWAEKI